MKVDKIISKIKEKSTKKNIIIWFIFFIVLEIIFVIGLVPVMSIFTNGEPILDLVLFYSPETAYNIIENFGERGIDFYKYIQLLDIFFPISYGFLFAFLLGWFSKKGYLYKKLDKIILAPFIAMIFDFFENIGIFIMLKRYPNEHHIIARLTGICTFLKFSIFTFFISVIILSLIFRFRNKIIKKG